MTRMKRALLLLGIAAFLIFLIVTLPAQLVASQLVRLGIVLDGVSGTAWNGRAQAVQVGSVNYGVLAWNLDVPALLRGRVGAHFNLQQGTAFAEGDVEATLSGRASLRDLSASWPLSYLSGMGIPAGWLGNLQIRLQNGVIDNGVPLELHGTIDLIDLEGPPRQPARVGSYRITFPAPNVQPSADTLAGAVSDLDGPMDVDGVLEIKRDRSYMLEGLIATRPDAPAQIVNALQFLGEPDAQGRRPFSLAGTY